MNIALAQPNLTIADFNGNVDKIKAFIQRAYAQGADIVVFPELIVGGYPAYGWYTSVDFQQACEKALREIASSCQAIACIIGSVYRDPTDGAVYNAAYVIQNAEVQAIITKKKLQTSYIDREADYFTAGTGAQVVTIQDTSLCIALADDAESIALAEVASVSAFIVLDNVPFTYLQRDKQLSKLRIVADKYGSPVFWSNQVGAQGDVIFAGGSLVVHSDGTPADEACLFQEDLRLYTCQGSDVRNLQDPVKRAHENIPLIHDALLLGIQDFFVKQGFTKAIVGLSGGLDSAVVVVLAARALGPENVHCILMPSLYSTDHSVSDAEALVARLGCAHTVLPIQSAFEAFKNTLEPLFKGLPFDITEENLQARTRGTLLMAVANKFGGIVLNTSNKSEAAMGYGTLYGDLVGSLSVIGDVYKTQVYDIARYINRNDEIIPIHILEKAPSAELRPGQKDSDSLPEYAQLDPILFQYIDLGRSVSEITSDTLGRSQILNIVRAVDRMEFKRHQTPPILGVSDNPFGRRKKIPEVKHIFPEA